MFSQIQAIAYDSFFFLEENATLLSFITKQIAKCYAYHISRIFYFLRRICFFLILETIEYSTSYTYQQIISQDISPLKLLEDIRKFHQFTYSENVHLS